jgi:OmpA-OmpF porin, OOP family
MEKFLKFILIIILAGLTISVNGQFKLKNKLNQTINSAAKGIEKAVTTPDKEQPEQKPEINADKNTQQQEKSETVQPTDETQQEAPAKEQAQLQSFSKYDFIPGEKVIFYEDFSQDAIGDFPALWNTNGSAEIVTTNLFPGNWMKYVCREAIWTDKPLNLPDNYTIEYDVIPTRGESGAMQGYSFRLMQCINEKSFDHGSVPGKAGFAFLIEYYGTPRYRTYMNSDEGANLGLSGSKEDEMYKQKENNKYHIAIWIQKARVRVYQDQNKLFDLPRAFSVEGVKMDRIRFENGAAMVSNIRVAVGAPDTRNKLITEGRLITYGIYFDVNKAEVKPESYGTLKDIAGALTDNPGVRVKIIGHTDSDGADAANLELSRKRADSVRDQLAKVFSIDPSRIETEGLGETKPIAPNDNPVNKALNRRVEFVKL